MPVCVQRSLLRACDGGCATTCPQGEKDWAAGVAEGEALTSACCSTIGVTRSARPCRT